MNDLELLNDVVDNLAPQLTDLADAIWDTPELRWEERRSMAAHIELANQHGFRITRNVAGIPTAFSAEKGTRGPVIAFLGEYDALADMS